MIIHIQWQGPLTLDGVKSCNGPSDRGVYQVYGYHSVYGPNSLLYIGKAKCFAERVPRDEWCEMESDEGEIRVYLGRLSGYETPRENEWIKQVDLVEAMLINAHKPARNRTLVADLPDSRDTELSTLHVLNWGNRARLLPEASGLRWTYVTAEEGNFFAYGEH